MAEISIQELDELANAADQLWRNQQMDTLTVAVKLLELVNYFVASCKSKEETGVRHG